MFRLFFYAICFTFMCSQATAQSEAQLLVTFDSIYRLGDPRSIIDVGEKWRAMVLEHGVQDTLKFVSRLIRIGDSYRFLGQPQKDLETLRPGFVLQPPGSPYYPDLLKMYGFGLYADARYQQADSCFQLSKVAYQQAGLMNTLRFITLLCAEADNYHAQGQILPAIASYEDALQRRAANNVPEDLSLGAIYNGLASCHQELGNVTRACDWIAKGTACYASFLPPEHPSVLTSKSTYVTLLLQSGQLAKAEPLALEVLKTMGEGDFKESIYYGGALESLAAVRGFLGQDAAGLVLLKEAGVLFERFSSANDPQVIQNKLHQAKFMVSLGKVQEARGLALEVKQTLESSANRSQTSLAEVLSFLATVSDNPEEGIQFGVDACKICQEATGKRNCGSMNDIPLELAFNYLKAGNYTKCAETLAVAEPDESLVFPKSHGYLQWLQYHALLEFAQHNWTSAQQYLERFLELRKEMASDELFLSNEVQWLDQIRFLRGSADLMFTMLQKSTAVDPGFYAKCIDFELFNKSVELSAAQKVREHIQQNTDLSPVFNAWLDTRERLGWGYLQPREVLEKQRVNLPALEQQADSLERELTQRSAMYAAASMRHAGGWSGIKKRLHAGEVAIEIAYYHDYLLEASETAHYAVLILRPDIDQPQYVFLPDADHFDQILLEKYLAECSMPTGKGQTGDLYAAFWQKLEPYLNGVSKVFVSADGAFFKLNLGAIQLPGGQYVADRYDVRRVFSLNDLTKENEDAKTGQKSAFLAGNPQFLLADAAQGQASTMRSVTETPDDTQALIPYNNTFVQQEDIRGLELKPLPESEKEVQDIAGLLRKKRFETTVVTGASASEESVKKLQSPAILHLATHGYFLANTRSTTAGLSKTTLDNNPMLRSMLFFSGAQNTLDKKTVGAEDGIMTAYEAQNLNLQGTELVVLSACKSAQGKIQNGAGVYGLQRALRIAGAQSVLLSLWDVDDKAGREFMVAFYDNWLNGMDKQDAFRRAQLDIKRKYPQPFYWAGFVLMGE